MMKIDLNSRIKYNKAGVVTTPPQLRLFGITEAPCYTASCVCGVVVWCFIVANKDEAFKTAKEQLIKHREECESVKELRACAKTPPSYEL